MISKFSIQLVYLYLCSTKHIDSITLQSTSSRHSKPECINNPIMVMGFWAMFTFQLDNSKR